MIGALIKYAFGSMQGRLGLSCIGALRRAGVFLDLSEANSFISLVVGYFSELLED